MGRGAAQDSDRPNATRRATAASTRLRQDAEALVPVLVEAGAEAVALFGSVARGSADDHSDIDIMAVWPDQPPRRSEIRKIVAGQGEGAEVSPGTWKRFENPMGQWSFFRMVGEEAIFLHDPDERLRTALRECPEPDEEQTEKCADRLAGQLKLYQRDPELIWMNGDHFFLYADSYRWSKVAVVDANMFSGVATHNRADAFRMFGERHPELAAELEWLQEIEPFYLANMGKSGRKGKQPFSHKDSTDEAWLTLCVAQEVIDVACAEMLASRAVPA